MVRPKSKVILNRLSIIIKLLQQLETNLFIWPVVCEILGNSNQHIASSSEALGKVKVCSCLFSTQEESDLHASFVGRAKET